MYHDTGLTYRLAKDQKEHKFINRLNDDLVTQEQIERIQAYIDDIVIEQFFTLNKFKPMLVPKSCIAHRYTNKGLIAVNDDFYLDLCNPFDRYTFVEVVSSYDFFESKFKYESYSLSLGYETKRYGAIGHVNKRSIDSIKNPYFELIEDRIKSFISITSPIRRGEALSLYKECAFQDPPYGDNCRFYHTLMSNFRYIFNEPVFQNYTYGEILSIYCILVEKLRITETNLTSLLALILPDKNDIYTSVIKQFYNFEMRIKHIFNEEMIDVRDLYLHFVSETKSKAFSFTNAKSSSYKCIRFLNQDPVYTVDNNNTVPLPFYYSKVDKHMVQL